MSHIKQTQQTSRSAGRSSALQGQPARRANAEHSVAQMRSEASTAASTIRSIPTRADQKHHDRIAKANIKEQNSSNPEVGSPNLLKRSLSKLRIKDAFSPSSKQDTTSTRRPLQPASRIPQATVPAPSHRAIGSRFGRSPAKAKNVHDRCAKKCPSPSPAHAQSPLRGKDVADIRFKAMQLGVFKITEADLKDRYQFLNEIGK